MNEEQVHWGLLMAISCAMDLLLFMDSICEGPTMNSINSNFCLNFHLIGLVRDYINQWIQEILSQPFSVFVFSYSFDDASSRCVIFSKPFVSFQTWFGQIRPHTHTHDATSELFKIRRQANVLILTYPFQWTLYVSSTCSILSRCCRRSNIYSFCNIKIYCFLAFCSCASSTMIDSKYRPRSAWIWFHLLL